MLERLLLARQLGLDKSAPVRDLDCSPHQCHSLALTPEVRKAACLVVERVGDDLIEPQPLSQRQCQIGKLHRALVGHVAHRGPREIGEESGAALGRCVLGKRFQCRFEHDDRGSRLGSVEQDRPERRVRLRGTEDVARFLVFLDRRASVPFSSGMVCRIGRGLCRADQELASIGRSAGHLQRLEEVCDRLIVGTQRRRPLGRRTEGESSLRRDGLGLRPLSGGVVCSEIVRRQGSGQLLVAERLEVPGDGEVAGPPFAAGERAVGDFADQ